MTLLGRSSQPRDTWCLSGCNISSAVRRVSFRLYSKLGRNNQIQTFNRSDGYFGKKLVPGDRLVAFCPSFHRWDVQSSSATYRENPNKEGPPVWSERSAWF